MTANAAAIHEEARAALEAGEPQKAFTTFRSLLEYPASLPDAGAFRSALGLLALIGAAIAGDEFAGVVQRAANDPDNAQALFDLGYQLIEQRLPGIAATVLLRARELAPQEEVILTELVTALDDCRFFDSARDELRNAGSLLETSFFCRYLLAFNSLMTGDLEAPARLLPGLLREAPDDLAVLPQRIAGMLARADAIRAVSPLDRRDLRGWHFVITGSILLRLSPYGVDDGMNGRYSYFQDAESGCLEGIRRLIAVLDAWQRRPVRVFVLPDHASAALAHACGQLLGVPLESWPANGVEAPGLIPVYDLEKLESECLQSLWPHRPGQILWAQASCWTRELPFAADLTTYLHQFNVSPWDSSIHLDPKTYHTYQSSPDESQPAELGGRIVAAAVAPGELDDLPTVLAFANAAATPTGEHGLSAFREEVNRRRQWSGSPVPSSHFFE